jgi:hypothetical protein
MKSRTKIVALFALFALTDIRPARAHHGFGFDFDANKTVIVHGKLSRIDLRLPGERVVGGHSYVYLIVNGVNGNTEWTADFFRPAGPDPSILKVGDLITITGNPSKSGEPRVLLQKLVRPSDGWQWAPPSATFGGE